MLIVFGFTMMELCFSANELPKNGDILTANNYSLEPSGRGANQALAACRAGAKVALVSKVGDDDFASHILRRLRSEGITTSGIGKSKAPTGCAIRINADCDESHHTVIFSANNEITSEQIPEEILTPQSVLLLQTEVKTDINTDILAKAKEAGAITIMNLSPANDLSKNTLKHLDYLIANQKEAEKLAIKLGLDSEKDAIKIAQALAKEGQLNCIITLGKDGCIALSKEGNAWKSNALDVEMIDKTGANDVYSGTFAAAIYMGLPLERAIKRASIAASLTCSKQGGQSIFPYLDDINSQIDNLTDAEEISL